MDEFEQLRDWVARPLQAQAKAAQAYLRLVELAERHLIANRGVGKP